MCPIHETDAAEERWSKAEWEHYELWEKIEARKRRLKRLWVSAVVMLFLVLSAVPVVLGRGLQWRALQASRQLAEQLNTLKREAIQREQAFRLTVDSNRPLVLQVEWGPGCDSSLFVAASPIELLPGVSARERLGWVAPSAAKDLGIAAALDRFCFDPIRGSHETSGDGELAAFLIAPVNELSVDRLSTVLLAGPSAEISFE